jgi:bifunctional UDP-N-acetylglucosamine pyrophosphorylase/glucosamine-1-phosphate N-acetyltransferase
MHTFAIILAAGKGTRMKSELPKVLHPVGGIPMIEHLVNKLERIRMNFIFTIVGHKGELVKEHLGARVAYLEQAEQLGTAHAVRQAESLLKGKQGATVVLTGDTPLIKQSTIEHLLRVQKAMQCAGVVLTAIVDNPTGYGRIIRDHQSGDVIDIIEEKDATPEQKQIREVNTGIFCFDNQSLFQALPGITNNNEQREFYLTDIVKVMKKSGLSNGKKRFEAIILQDPVEVMGINSPDQLAEADRAYHARIQASA